MVTFGSLLSPWLTTFPKPDAFCKKRYKTFFFVNILQFRFKKKFKQYFFQQKKFLLNNHKIEILNVII
jgi:hypothetical protein